MKKLQLPDVTLVMIETREHELAALAVSECLDKADFGDVIVLTDHNYPERLVWHRSGVRFHRVPDWPDKVGWARSMWYDVPPLVRTSHMLCIQWDSWIWTPEMWRDEFLGFDYIGAPWWYKDGKNVGNSGFCLKSTRLARYLRDRRDQFPCDTHVEDDLLCRGYRPKLEDRGFLWAPERIAYDFSYEGCGADSKPTKHFGFHGAFNFGAVLDHDKLLQRARLMIHSPGIGNPDGYIMRAFRQKNPGVIEELSSASRGVVNV